MNDSTILGIVVAGVVFGSPLVYAAMGELLSERAGVLNLSLEGIMLMGAVSSYGVAAATGSLWLGLVAASVVGMMISGILAVLAVLLRVSQVLTGLGLLIMCTGLAAFIGRAGDNPLSGRLAGVSIEPSLAAGAGVADWPIVGPVLFGHDFFVYGGWLLALATWYYIDHTRAGLAVRAAGSNPSAAEASGVLVTRLRLLHTTLGGALAALGGAYYSLALLNSWQEGLTAGAGWLAIAIVLAARWRPWIAFAATFVFGASIRLGFTLQAEGNTLIPVQVLSMIPYLLAIFAVLMNSRLGKIDRNRPHSLAVPFFREDR